MPITTATQAKMALAAAIPSIATAGPAIGQTVEPSPDRADMVAERIAIPVRYDQAVIEDMPGIREFLDTLFAVSAPPEFQAAVAETVERSPIVDEAFAGFEEAEAAGREARSVLFPTLDLALSGRTSFARNFSNDPDNVVERARSQGRADATAVLDQRIFDFGATANRIDASRSIIEAAASEVERQRDQIALQAIGAWYDVFAYQALVELTGGHIRRQDEIRQALVERIELGASAPADLAQIDSEIANANVELTLSRRLLASASARFEQLYHREPPQNLARAPLRGQLLTSLDAARMAALETPAVRIAEAQARAATNEARAARRDTLPTVNAGVEAGRFGLFSGNNDYDVRGTVTVRHRFFGPGDARADQARARATAGEARAEAVRTEALRLASTAWTDMQTYRDQLRIAREGYLASAYARHVAMLRFQTVRGTLFDVLQAETELVASANRLIQTVAEHDTTYFVLLARTGHLLPALDIPSSGEARQ